MAIYSKSVGCGDSYYLTLTVPTDTRSVERSFIMNCLTCSHYYTPLDLITKCRLRTYVIEELLDEIEKDGFSGYCSEHNVCVLEFGCCSLYCKR